MPLSLDTLRPCDACDGPLKSGLFYRVEIDLAVVDPSAVRDYAGVTTILGGTPQAAAVAEHLSPGYDRAIRLLSEQDGGEKTVVILCQDCYIAGGSLAVAAEKIHAREERESGGEGPSGGPQAPPRGEDDGEAALPPRGDAAPSSTPRERT